MRSLLVLSLVFFLFTFSLVSGIALNNPNLPLVSNGEVENESLFNVNNSQYLIGVAGADYITDYKDHNPITGDWTFQGAVINYSTSGTVYYQDTNVLQQDVNGFFGANCWGDSNDACISYDGGNNYWDFIFSSGKQMRISTGVADKVIIDSVGIGVDVTPNDNFHSYGAGDGIELEGDNIGSNIWIHEIKWTNTDIGKYDASAIRSYNEGGTNQGDLRFYTADGGTLTERMHIHDGGEIDANGDFDVYGDTHLRSALTVGDFGDRQNITIYSANGSQWSCGPDNNGNWGCV